jgi:signal transduction histidine kinase
VGLGLYISKHIVNLHDGTLRAENRPNRGCRFVVEIPLLITVDDEEGEKASTDF